MDAMARITKSKAEVLSLPQSAISPENSKLDKKFDLFQLNKYKCAVMLENLGRQLSRLRVSILDCLDMIETMIEGLQAKAEITDKHLLDEGILGVVLLYHCTLCRIVLQDPSKKLMVYGSSSIDWAAVVNDMMNDK